MVEALLKGSVAGTLASLVPAAVGKTEGILVLPDGESADRAPRVMARLAAMRGATLSPRERWAQGTVFHLGYDAGWGKLYALGRERVPVHPAIGGLLLGSGTYGDALLRHGDGISLRGASR
jgi:hypothetical protein